MEQLFRSDDLERRYGQSGYLALAGGGRYSDAVQTSDLTIEILQAIRDEVRQTNQRLEQLDSNLSRRLDETNVHLDRLDRRQTESEVRLATEVTAMVRAVDEVRDLLRDRLDLRDDVRDLDRRVSQLEHRVGG